MAAACPPEDGSLRVFEWSSIPQSGPVWGDGFADDSLADLYRVTDWAQVSVDEYAVLFPQLACRAGAFPAPLRSHLERVVSVRRWRLEAFEGRSGPPSAHVVPDCRDWFSYADVLGHLLRKARLWNSSLRVTDQEPRLLHLLEGILEGIEREEPPAWDADAESEFPFATGIHPGYLWKESTLSVERGATAAWLGHLDRGRSALMPRLVADYLADAVVGREGARDATMAALAERVMPLSKLRRAALSCLDGRTGVVAAPRWSSRSRLPSMPRAAPFVSKEVSLERA